MLSTYKAFLSAWVLLGWRDADDPAPRGLADRRLPQRPSASPCPRDWPGWVMVVNLLGLEVRETIGCTEQEARRVLRLIEAHQADLMEAWKRHHD